MDADELRRRQEARILDHWRATRGQGVPSRPSVSMRVDAPDLAQTQREAEARARAMWDLNEELPPPTGTRSIALALDESLRNTRDDLTGTGTGAPYLGGREGQAYTEYFRSPHWRATRQRMLDRAGGLCRRCRRRFKPSALDVHHLNYRHLGAERERDLEVLCRECHQVEHGRSFDAEATDAR